MLREIEICTVACLLHGKSGLFAIETHVDEVVNVRHYVQCLVVVMSVVWE
jgi:hypothetical protein